jgi:ribosomal protein S15
MVLTYILLRGALSFVNFLSERFYGLSVSVAVLTERIRHLTEHMKGHRQDKNSERNLVRLVHKRRSMMQYMLRKSPGNESRALTLLLSFVSAETGLCQCADSNTLPSQASFVCPLFPFSCDDREIRGHSSSIGTSRNHCLQQGSWCSRC